MPVAMAASFGLNAVDPQHYQGWRGKLWAAENDARAMERVARANGFQTRLVLTRDATRATFQDAWQDAIVALGPGDIFLLTVACHGGELRAREDVTEQMDQTLCLFDGEWLDNETYELLCRMSSGVRVLAIYDTCHSETQLRIYPRIRETGVLRLMPEEVAARTYRANKRFYDRLANSARRARTRSIVRASAIALAACRDYESARDGAANGLFTEALLRTWGNGAFTGNYRDFHRLIEASVANESSQQHPTLRTYGQGVETFLDQIPFSRGGRTVTSQPSGSTGAQGNRWTWGIQRTRQGVGRGTTGGGGRQPVTRGFRGGTSSGKLPFHVKEDRNVTTT